MIQHRAHRLAGVMPKLIMIHLQILAMPKATNTRLISIWRKMFTKISGCYFPLLSFLLPCSGLAVQLSCLGDFKNLRVPTVDLLSEKRCAPLSRSFVREEMGIDKQIICSLEYTDGKLILGVGASIMLPLWPITELWVGVSFERVMV